jgi:shikimate dehydrogenase
MLMKKENLKSKAAVIGSPISHSLSPFIFSFIAHKENYEIDYQSIEVTADSSHDFLSDLKNKKDFLGCNVTIPLKETFLNNLSYCSPEVEALGALNVLQFVGQEIRGFNTDIIGIQKTLDSQNFSLKGKTCLILGAGGAAKATAFVLGSSNAKEVIIFNRSGRHQQLVDKFATLFPKVHWSAIHEMKHDTPIDLIVNSTPLGMTGKESGEEFFKSLKNLTRSPHALAFDLIYTPEETEFIRVARSLGMSTVGGLGMLIDQALATWKIWVGDLKDEIRLHNDLRDFLNGVLWLRQNKQALYLTGFMGVGKSSVGHELAAALKRLFLDTDKIIQDETHLSITEIFAQKGEKAFREMEKDTIENLAKSTQSHNSVISLGGGALMNNESFKNIQSSGLLIYLKASAEILLERINTQAQVRPLLANLSKDEQLKKISELLELRKNIYEQASVCINTDTFDVKEICFEIISAIGKIQRKD